MTNQRADSFHDTDITKRVQRPGRLLRLQIPVQLRLRSDSNRHSLCEAAGGANALELLLVAELLGRHGPAERCHYGCMIDLA